MQHLFECCDQLRRREFHHSQEHVKVLLADCKKGHRFHREKECASAGGFKSPFSIIDGAGEAAFNVTE